MPMHDLDIFSDELKESVGGLGCDVRLRNRE